MGCNIFLFYNEEEEFDFEEEYYQEGEGELFLYIISIFYMKLYYELLIIVYLVIEGKVIKMEVDIGIVVLVILERDYSVNFNIVNFELFSEIL